MDVIFIIKFSTCTSIILFYFFYLKNHIHRERERCVFMLVVLLLKFN